MTAAREVAEVDPFDLPEWLGTTDTVWSADSGVRGPHHVRGRLVQPGAAAETSLPCDLLGADQAYPDAVLAEPWRRRAHQSWVHGQVLLLDLDDRLTLVVPGTGFTADLVLETLSRLAKAVGAPADRVSALLRP